jgi:hypothetical protein
MHCLLLRPATVRRFRVRVTHPTVILRRVPHLTGICPFVENVIWVECVRWKSVNIISRRVTSVNDLRSASSASTTRLLPKALALGLIGVRISSSYSRPSASMRGTTIPKGGGVGFDTPPFGASEGASGGLGTVARTEGRPNTLRSGEGVWERCITSPGERGPWGAGGGSASDC